MKKVSTYTCLALLLAACAILSCKKEQAAAPASLAVKYTNLSLTDLIDLPNPNATEQLLIKLFDLKEQGGGLTDSELRSLGDPARNPDLLYALLFVEAYDREEILWSWKETQTAEETSPEDELAERSGVKKWTYTGGAPLASLYCSGFKKYPAWKLKNPVTDPCGDHLTGVVYKCCFDLCDTNYPVPCQTGCQANVTIPAGSVDALAAAIAAVCVNGTVTLAAGTHTENAGLVITKRVNIKGESGAVLVIQTTPWTDATVPMDAALHVKTRGVKIEGIDIQPTTNPGGMAVLLEKASEASIHNNHFTNFQYGVLVEKSDDVEISHNVIALSNAWQTGVIPEALGITVINGARGKIHHNETSNGLFGNWLCSDGGEYHDNYTHDNYIGMILCKVPAGGFRLPDGSTTGSAEPGNGWDVHDNKSTNNANAGYLVIDGANHNNLKDNEGGNNATYDIELTGDTYRFGFLTPKSSWNQVRAGDFPNVTIKDCGLNNVVIGGVKIDTGSDPCN